MAPDIMTPPSTPMMNNAPVQDAQEVAEDDIEDPAVPAGLAAQLTPTAPPDALKAAPPTLPETFERHPELVPLFQGFCQHLGSRLEKEFTTYATSVGKTLDEMYDYLKQQRDLDKAKVQHAETLLDQLVTKAVEQGIQLRHDPYVVTLQAVTPEGFPVTITMTGSTEKQIVDTFTSLRAGLASAGYTAPWQEAQT
jgi:hypothetical protein